MILFPGEGDLSLGHPCREMRVGRWRVACIFQTPPACGPSSSGAALRLAEDLVADALGVANHKVRVATLLPSGRPIAAVSGQASCPTVSVSHVRDMYGAALSFDGQVGIDIVCPHDGTASLRTFFTPEERAMLPRHTRHWYASLWAAKEAAYKAAGLDIEFQPLRVHVRDLGPDRFQWSVSGPHDRVAGAGRLAMVGQHVVALAVTRRAGKGGVGDECRREELEKVSACF